jgi:hypothetical protein
MIPTLLCMFMRQAPTAADYFPVVPGTVRTYQDKSGNTLINTIRKPLDMGGVAAIPINESLGAGLGKTTYYRVDADMVSIVAYDIKNPLPTPMPVLKLGTGKISWDFQGRTATGASGERLLARGEAKFAGQKMILGNKVDILVVNLAAAVGNGMSGYTIEQTTTYGKGLGIVEQKTKMTLGKRTNESLFKLVSVSAEK